jgi:hypothetical protein
MIRDPHLVQALLSQLRIFPTVTNDNIQVVGCSNTGQPCIVSRSVLDGGDSGLLLAPPRDIIEMENYRLRVHVYVPQREVLARAVLAPMAAAKAVAR